LVPFMAHGGNSSHSIWMSVHTHSVHSILLNRISSQIGKLDQLCKSNLNYFSELVCTY